MISVNNPIQTLTVYRHDPACFDFSTWSDVYGSGVFQVWHRPPGAHVSHKVDLAVDGSRAVWIPSEDDAAGTGSGHLVYNADSGVYIRSELFSLQILER